MSCCSFKPGKVYNYSNYSYLLLGLIIEKESEMTFSEYLEDNLFKKAGMSNTIVVGEQNINDNRIASGYEKVGSVFTNNDIQAYTFSQLIFSAGNIVSTPEDLNKWYKALFSGQIIGKDLLEKAHTPHISTGRKGISYGYGWIIDNSLGKGKKIIRHNGRINGFFSNIIFYPRLKTLVILLSNFGYPTICISGLERPRTTTMINHLPSIMLSYATGIFDRPMEINILPDSECKRPPSRDSVLRSLEGPIYFENDPSDFIPMSEILKEIRK